MLIMSAFALLRRFPLPTLSSPSALLLFTLLLPLFKKKKYRFLLLLAAQAQVEISKCYPPASHLSLSSLSSPSCSLLQLNYGSCYVLALSVVQNRSPERETLFYVCLVHCKKFQFKYLILKNKTKFSLK